MNRRQFFKWLGIGAGGVAGGFALAIMYSRNNPKRLSGIALKSRQMGGAGRVAAWQRKHGWQGTILKPTQKETEGMVSRIARMTRDYQDNIFRQEYA